jgi:hypothetical protein
VEYDKHRKDTLYSVTDVVEEFYFDHALDKKKLPSAGEAWTYFIDQRAKGRPFSSAQQLRLKKIFMASWKHMMGDS